jgi:hypothetical protein
MVQDFWPELFRPHEKFATLGNSLLVDVATNQEMGENNTAIESSQ